MLALMFAFYACVVLVIFTVKTLVLSSLVKTRLIKLISRYFSELCAGKLGSMVRITQLCCQISNQFTGSLNTSWQTRVV